MEKKKNITNLIAAFLILAAGIVLCLYFGMQKEGFHQDEYYSYYSSNRTAGLYTPDREWVDTDTILNEFEVLPGEGFNYSLVATVQSWDVHPPLFYDLLHTACSLYPGHFSKWYGIGVNMCAFILCFLALYALLGKLTSNPVRILILAAWTLNPMTISCVMFIRMYMLLTFFIFMCAYLYVSMILAIKDDENNLPSYKKLILGCLPIMLVSFLGFLMQYYYFIFFFFMGAGFTIWLFIRFGLNKETFLKAILHVVMCAVSLGCAVLVYPSSASHILRGYRGKEAMTEFASVTNIFERFAFFIGLLNDYVFGGFFYIVLAIVVICFIVLFIIEKRRLKAERVKPKFVSYFEPAKTILGISLIGYFFVVAKTALLLGDTSNRYEMPIYGLIIAIVILAGEHIVYAFSKDGISLAMPGNNGSSKIFSGLKSKKNLVNGMTVREDIEGCYIGASTDNVGKNIIPLIAYLLSWVVVLFVCLTALFTETKVLFLYPEDSARIQYAKENSDTDVIILYNDQTPDNVWRLTDELLEYKKLYFVSEANTDTIADLDIRAADKLIVYAADNDNKEEMLDVIDKSNYGANSVKEISTKDMWTVYEIG